MENHVQRYTRSEAGKDCHAEYQRRRTKENAERALALEEAMFDWRSRHLILVLTFNYKPEYRGVMTLNDLRRDRDRFLGNMRENPMLQAINAYIWKIEEGRRQGGLHLHVVLFYSSEHYADAYVAQKVGEYWEEVVTRGRGAFWNSNAHKKTFSWKWGDGTGQIDRSNSAKRESLRRYLAEYVAKEDQQVSSRMNPHARMFGTSRLPS